MNNIEVLGYILQSSQKMADFIVFCTSGTPGKSTTEPGVFEWLHSRTIQEAHFFTSRATDSTGVFGATILKPVGEPDPTVVPWMDKIKGFKKFVSTDGALGGLVDVFPQLTATVTHNQFLDDEYAKGAKSALEIFDALKATDRSGFSFTTEQFAAALRGDAKVDREGILSEIEKKLGKPLFEKPDLAKLLKSIGVDS